MSLPTDFTVPTAVGGEPQVAVPLDWAVNAEPAGADDDTGEPDDPDDEAAPATPPATASPRATAAAVVTRTPRLRRVAPAASAAVPEPGRGAPNATGPTCSGSACRGPGRPGSDTLG